MPEHWKQIFEGPLGMGIAGVLGAAIRGLIGPGAWHWGEFARACFVVVVFCGWIAPGVAEWLELSQRASTTLGGVVGIIGLPVVRGLIGLARSFRDDPEDFLRRLFGRDGGHGR